MSEKSIAMLNLFKNCKLKHKSGCFADTCEECIDRFDHLPNSSQQQEIEKNILLAVKKFLNQELDDEEESWDKDFLISVIVEEIDLLKGYELSLNECEIIWGNNEICNLEDFTNSFFDIFIKKISNVLDSFIKDASK